MTDDLEEINSQSRSTTVRTSLQNRNLFLRNLSLILLENGILVQEISVRFNWGLNGQF